jgi:hypothetical protein
LLEFSQSVQKLGCGDLTNGTIAKSLERGLEQPAILFLRRLSPALASLLLQ